MHNSRLFALVGVGIGLMGLLIKTLSTAGEGLLPTLSQTGTGFPDGIPTIWGGLAAWAQVLLVILAVAVVTVALLPDHRRALDRTSGAVVAVIGLAMVGYAVSQWLNAGSDADALQSAFLRSARQGVIGASYSVHTSTGFVILLVGAALVTFGGVLGFRAEQKTLV